MISTQLDSEVSGWMRGVDRMRTAFAGAEEAATALTALVEQLGSANRSLAELAAGIGQAEHSLVALGHTARTATADLAARNSETTKHRETPTDNAPIREEATPDTSDARMHPQVSGMEAAVGTVANRPRTLGDRIASIMKKT